MDKQRLLKLKKKIESLGNRVAIIDILDEFSLIYLEETAMIEDPEITDLETKKMLGIIMVKNLLQLK